MSPGGPGHSASDERSAPVTCRQEVQWQEEDLRGRAEGGRGEVEKERALQRQEAVRVIFDIFVFFLSGCSSLLLLLLFTFLG